MGDELAFPPRCSPESFPLFPSFPRNHFGQPSVPASRKPVLCGPCIFDKYENHIYIAAWLSGISIWFHAQLQSVVNDLGFENTFKYTIGHRRKHLSQGKTILDFAMTTTYPKEKSSQSTIENLHDETKDNGALVSILPLSLQHLSPEELVSFRKKMVRKIDIRLMPMLIILFLLK